MSKNLIIEVLIILLNVYRKKNNEGHFKQTNYHKTELKYTKCSNDNYKIKSLFSKILEKSASFHNSHMPIKY